MAELIDRWTQQAGQPRQKSPARRIIHPLPATPIIDSASARQITDANESATLRALNRLEAAGVLARVTVGKRNRQWECVGLFALLEEMERTLPAGQRGAAGTG